MKLRNVIKGAIPALLVLAATPALAVTPGVNAGTAISNQASVAYSVGATAQDPVDSNLVTFSVDRKVNLTVVEVLDAGAPQDVTPNTSDQVLAFDVTNLTNDTVDFVLTVNQNGADGFDATSVRVYLDNEGAGSIGSFDAANDTNITATLLLNDVVEDDTQRVFVVANIPSTATDGQEDLFTLVATAAEADGTDNDPFTESAGDSADPLTVDTVLADTDRNNDERADDAYRVRTATLGVYKFSRVVSDPLNLTTNPKRIPGATVEFCIAVENTGSTAASSVVLTDTVDADLTPAGGIFEGTVNNTTDITDETTAATVCSGNATTAGGGSFTGQLFTSDSETVSPDSTHYIRFNVTIE